MVNLGVEGFAIGGVAVGEPQEEMLKAVEGRFLICQKMLQTFARRGYAFDIVQAVAARVRHF